MKTLSLSIISALLLVGCSSSGAQHKTVIKHCSSCHSAQIVEKKKGLSHIQWLRIIERMKNHKLEISQTDQEFIAKHLSEKYK